MWHWITEFIRTLKAVQLLLLQPPHSQQWTAQGLSLLGLQQTKCSLVPCDGAHGYPPQKLFLAFSPFPLIGPFGAIPRPLQGRTPGLPSKRWLMGNLRASAQPVLGHNPSLLESKRPCPEISIFPVCLIVQFGVCVQTRVLRTGPHLAGMFSYPWTSAQAPDLSVAPGRPALQTLLCWGEHREGNGPKVMELENPVNKFTLVQFGLGE